MPPPKVAIAAIQQLGLRALRPTFNTATQRWRKPVVSPRVAAKIRKYAMTTRDVGKGKMWDPVWDVKPPKVHSLRSPRGNKADRTREMRAQKVSEQTTVFGRAEAAGVCVCASVCDVYLIPLAAR